MNLKHFVYGYTGEKLSWLDGSILKSKYDLNDTVMCDVDMAIFFKNALANAFRNRENSLCPEIWDETINRRSAEYVYYLKKLEAV